MSARVDVWGARAQVICPFEDVSLHAHAVGAWLCGLDSSFELITASAHHKRVHRAFVPPGCLHRLRVHGGRLSVIYLAPGMRELSAVAKIHDIDAGQVQILKRDDKMLEYARACWDERILDEDLEDHLAALLGTAAPCSVSEEPRVKQLLARFPLGEKSSGQERGRLLGLGSSRVRELVRKHLAASWQQLHRWQRMRAVSSCLAQGSSLTQAAHACGFTDSAQLCRDFRATFGVAPSRVYNEASVRAHECEAMS